MKFSDYAEDLYWYQPDSIGNDVDAQTVQEMCCPECSNDLEYRSYRSPLARSYRTFAVCPKCDWALEF